jgi:UDP-glucose 4-epimerase
MAVLVTGGAGYIGSHMVLALLERGEAVVVLDNLTSGARWVVPDEAQFILGDIGDAYLLNELIATYRIDAIIHFAGSVVVPASIADPLGYYLNNTVKTHTLVQAALRNNVRDFIFSSTAAVYGIPDHCPVHEDAGLKPISPYGSSKMMVEMMLADVSRASDLRYAAIRYFNVAGAHPFGRTGQCSAVATHLIKVACQVALDQRPYLEVFGTDYPTHDGTCIRDYVHVTDLVQAHLRCLSWLREGSGRLVVNCGYGRGYSVLEVIDSVKRVSGVDFKVRNSPRRAGDPACLVAGSDLIRRTLDWKPEFDELDRLVEHALSWERSLAKRRSGTAA